MNRFRDQSQLPIRERIWCAIVATVIVAAAIWISTHAT